MGESKKGAGWGERHKWKLREAEEQTSDVSIARSLVSSTEEVFSSTTSACGAGCERSASEDEVSEVHPRSCCAADSDVTAEVRTVGTSSVCVLVRVIAPTSPRVSPATRSPQLMRLPRSSPSLAQLLQRDKKNWGALCSGECSQCGMGRGLPVRRKKAKRVCVRARAWTHLRSVEPRHCDTAGRDRKFLRGGKVRNQNMWRETENYCAAV